MTESTLERVISVNVIEQLIGIGLSKGGDFAEIYVERSATNSLSLEEHKIRGASYGVSLGVGIRVLKGEEVGYAFCDDLDLASLREAAGVAAAIARGGGCRTPKRVGRKEIPSRYPVKEAIESVDPKRKIRLLMEGDAAAHAYDKRVTQLMGSFVDQTRDILIANSDGILASDHQVMCRMSFSAIAEDAKGDRRTGFHGGGGRVDFAHYDSFTGKSVAQEAARMAVAQLGAQDAPAGPQTVVLSPGWSGILLHEAVGHGLEADFIRKKTSLYADQLGQKVASELCTVIDSGEPPHRRGTLNIDDEGEVAKEKVLIEKGILRSYLTDRINADAMGIARTGSGRRQSYKHAPMPRMTNTFLAPGPHKHDEIVQSVKKGLYCAAFGGGQVDITNGNFVFEVQEGYLIEDGRLTAPVKNATLIGVGPEALKNVSMVADNPKLDPGIGTCGKDGQTVPVGVGLPTVRIDNLTVGGTHAG